MIGLHWKCAHWREVPTIPVTPPQYGPYGPEAEWPPRDLIIQYPEALSERVSEVQADGPNRETVALTPYQHLG